MAKKGRKELLRSWLKGKSFYPADIRYALTWWEEQVAAGKDPTDAQVLAIADEGHKRAVEDLPQRSLVIRHEYQIYSAVWAFAGSFVGTALALTIYEVVKWLDLVTMLLP